MSADSGNGYELGYCYGFGQGYAQGKEEMVFKIEGWIEEMAKGVNTQSEECGCVPCGLIRRVRSSSFS